MAARTEALGATAKDDAAAGRFRSLVTEAHPDATRLVAVVVTELGDGQGVAERLERRSLRTDEVARGGADASGVTRFQELVVAQLEPRSYLFRRRRPSTSVERVDEERSHDVLELAELEASPHPLAFGQRRVVGTSPERALAS